MSQSEDDPNMPLAGAFASGSGDSVARTIARLETAVVRLRAALVRERSHERAGAARDGRDGQEWAAEMAAENALLRAERDRLQQELDELRRAYADLKRRSDSAGAKVTRTIEELEAMLGETG